MKRYVVAVSYTRFLQWRRKELGTKRDVNLRYASQPHMLNGVGAGVEIIMVNPREVRLSPHGEAFLEHLKAAESAGAVLKQVAL